MHAVIMSRGVVLCKFLPLTDASVFVNFIGPYMYGVFKNTVEIVGQKLKTNKALLNVNEELTVRFAYEGYYRISCDGLLSEEVSGGQTMNKKEITSID